MSADHDVSAAAPTPAERTPARRDAAPGSSPALPPATLLQRLAATGRANHGVRQAAILQLQRTYGNRAVQRTLAAGLVGAGPGAAPTGIAVQTKIISPFAQEAPTDAIATIQAEVVRYNTIGGYRIFFSVAERQLALTQLAAVERLIYGWFTAHPTTDLAADPMARRMKTLMNAVQAERIDLVGRAISNGDANPPVANFAGLPGGVQTQVRQVWQKLLRNEGIAINGDDPAFRTKILADFSRLLELELGRRMIVGIQVRGQAVTITPTTLAAGKFVAQPTDSEAEALGLAAPDTDTSTYVPVDFRGQSQADRLALLQDLRIRHPASRGVRVTAEGGVRAYSFGTGTGSTLPVPSDAQDAMTHPASRMADAQGHEVIAPTFINLGHELGHVLRSAQGMSAVAVGGNLMTHGFPTAAAWDRPEEFFNIEGIENPLRAQAGIAGRHGHGNLYSHWAVALMDQIEGVAQNIAGQLHNPLAHAVQPALRQLQTELLALQDQVQALMGGTGIISALRGTLAQLGHTYATLAEQIPLPPLLLPEGAPV